MASRQRCNFIVARYATAAGRRGGPSIFWRRSLTPFSRSVKLCRANNAGSRSTRPHTNTHTHACTRKLTPASELTRGSADRTSSSPAHSLCGPPPCRRLLLLLRGRGPRSVAWPSLPLTSQRLRPTLSSSPRSACRAGGRAVGRWVGLSPSRRDP